MVMLSADLNYFQLGRLCWLGILCLTDWLVGRLHAAFCRPWLHPAGHGAFTRHTVFYWWTGWLVDWIVFSPEYNPRTKCLQLGLLSSPGILCLTDGLADWLTGWWFLQTVTTSCWACLHTVFDWWTGWLIDWMVISPDYDYFLLGMLAYCVWLMDWLINWLDGDFSRLWLLPAGHACILCVTDGLTDGSTGSTGRCFHQAVTASSWARCLDLTYCVWLTDWLIINWIMFFCFFSRSWLLPAGHAVLTSLTVFDWRTDWLSIG